MNDLHCPYCDENLGDHIDDCHEADTEYEYECTKCDKSFIFTITYYPTFSSYKADCLNGGKHNYEKMCGIPEEMFKNKYKCKDCGKEIKE